MLYILQVIYNILHLKNIPIFKIKFRVLNNKWSVRSHINLMPNLNSDYYKRILLFIRYLHIFGKKKH